jgi:DNA (cytosine-5)-methyltransferase 1
MRKEITIGSLFSGIGGFELGLERGIPGSNTIWQVEQDPFCRSILRKHWPGAQLYEDVRTVGKHNLASVDVLCGGFPCQNISIAGKREGINEGEKSSLWWEFRRIIGELRPRIVVIENVSAITFSDGGGWDLLGSLAQIGYDAEWIDLRASDFGAPHRRERIFFVAYPDNRIGKSKEIRARRTIHNVRSFGDVTNTTGAHVAANGHQSRTIEEESGNTRLQIATDRSRQNGGVYRENYWEGFPVEPPFCSRNDGVPNRVARLRALGNSIVPQCSEWIGMKILESGLLQ